MPAVKAFGGRSQGHVTIGVGLGVPSRLHGPRKVVLLTPVDLLPLLLLAACQLNCSDHGHCDSFTKRCVCDPFWMENFIKVQLRDGDSNCGEFPALTVPAGLALTVALS